jgi:periplasmic protein TonB
MSSVYKPPQGKNTRTPGILFGVVISCLLFLAIPLTQIFTEYKKAPEEIQGLDVAPPPPPPPPEDPPPPPEPEEEEPPPELEAPPPPISLEQLDMALDPGTGDSIGGEFAMPKLNINKKDLGDLDIFDINDLTEKPRPRKQAPPIYPLDAKRRGLSGYVVIGFVIDERGRIINEKILQSSDPIFEKPTLTAVSTWEYTPPMKDGKAVKTRFKMRIPYNIDE